MGDFGYSKQAILNLLNNSVTNAEVSTSAAIAKSKLAALSITNSDLSGSAEITDANLAQITNTAKLPSSTVYNDARWGYFAGGSNQGEGLLNMFTDGTLGVERGTDYTATTFTTAATDNSVAGIHSNFGFTQMNQSPRLKIEFKDLQTTEKLWVGMEPGSFAGGDDPLDTNTGVMVGHDAGDTDFKIRWNDGTAGAPQNFNTGTTKDTIYHVVEFFLDSAASAVKVSWNGTQVVNSTTQEPPATTALNIHAACEAEGATATTMAIKYMRLTFG